MRRLLQRLLNPWLWFVLSLAGGLSGLVTERLKPDGRGGDRQGTRIERNFQSLDTRVGELLRDTALLSDLALGCEDAPDTEFLRQIPFGLYLFRADSLLWWNNNRVLPDPRITESGEPQAMVRLANGFYVLRSVSWGDLKAIGLIPIRSEYSLVNRYLRPVFFEELAIPEQALLLSPDMPGYSIRDARGATVFSLHFAQQADSDRMWKLAPELFCLFALFIGVFLLARRLAQGGREMAGALVITIILLVLHLALINSIWPREMFSLPLFDPHYYASPGIAASLGHLLLDSLLAGLLGLYLLGYTRPETWLRAIPVPGYLSAGLPVFLLLVLFRAVVNVFFSLVADSNISFDLDNFLRLDAFSFGALITAALLLTDLYLLGRWLARGWKRVCPSVRHRAISAAMGIVVYLFLFLVLPHGQELFVFQHLLSALVFLGLAQWFSTPARSEFSLPGLLIWTAYFAAFASALLIRTDTRREEAELQRYALRLASDQDPVMEYLFADVAPAVRQDPFVRNLFADAYPAVRAADEQILDVYLSDYFDRYHVSLYYFNREGIPLHTGPSPGKHFLDSLIQARGEATGSDGLFHLMQSGRLEYLARIAVSEGDRSGGAVYIRLESKVMSGTSLYPELLMRDPGFTDPEGYDYAVYRGQNLLSQQGDYPYPLLLPSAWNTGLEFSTNRTAERFHLIHHNRDGKVVVISRPFTGWIVPLSLFSYLFLFLLLFASFLALPVMAGQVWLRPHAPGAAPGFSLRGRIQSFVVLLTLLSFIIIGGITISYFNRQSQEYHRSRLLRKLTAVASEIEYESGGGRELSEAGRRKDPRWPYDQGVRSDLGALSEIHTIDLNIYDTLGVLQQSSQPDIFSKGLLSKVMEPAAWVAMKRQGCSHWIQSEKIGTLEFLSAYRPLQSAGGSTVAYLQMPYFAKEKNQRQEVAGFMVALINVYVLLLVAAGLVALGISNSVTRSLAQISAQFQKIKVGERNEPITWKSNDEIGLLVAEYNKMLAALERSAALLARSERESAWREMARQVAHEIKNPLTPMRLSVQHLQRAIAAGDPRAEELTQRVSRTLLEQIDTLTHIATEFSNFAQMPTPKPERMALGAVLRSSVELFAADDTADLQLALPSGEVVVWADREQLKRVFTNLIKNAIQAIPDERRGLIRVVMGSFAGQVRVQVIDNGIGIPKDQQGRVFVPNFTTKNSGMGLGLAMCKNIVEYAGGRIEFSSEPDRGTTFSVTLPVLPEADPD